MDKVDGIGCASSACMIDHVLTNHRQPCEGQSAKHTCFAVWATLLPARTSSNRYSKTGKRVKTGKTNRETEI